MIVLKIIGIVFGAILFIIALILSLPLKILAFTDENGDFKLLYRILFLTFGKHPDPNGLIVRTAKALTGLDRVLNAENVKRSVDSSGVTYTVSQIVDILAMLIGRVVWILKYCSLQKLEFHVICSGTDAAETAADYGRVCAVLYPLIGYLKTIMHVRERGLDVQIGCDYTGELGAVTANAVVSVRIIHIARALLHIIKRNVEKEVYSS